jgi:hypothetical protein
MWLRRGITDQLTNYYIPKKCFAMCNYLQSQPSQCEKSLVFLNSKDQKSVLPPLQAYENCPRWKAEVDSNNRTLEEKHMFQLGPQMQALLQNVSERLGFSYRLTFGKHQHNIELIVVSGGHSDIIPG